MPTISECSSSHAACVDHLLPRMSLGAFLAWALTARRRRSMLQVEFPLDQRDDGTALVRQPRRQPRHQSRHQSRATAQTDHPGPAPAIRGNGRPLASASERAEAWRGP